MAEIQAGVTALVTAYARARHATQDESPKIFDDFLADQYYTAEEHIAFDHNLAAMLPAIDPELAATNPDEATALSAVMQTMHEPVTLSRSRYGEDSLDEALKQGIGQYVILGAGFDTFAFRRTDLADRLQVFEVDHPVTQGMKQQRITMAGWATPANFHFVPIDFTQESLADALGLSSYDSQKLTFFSWQGVTYYLPRESIFATLRAIASLAPKGSQIIFDYMDEDAFNPERAAKRTQLMHATARRVGEPMKTGFNPLTLADELQQVGFRLVENLAPVEIQPRYFSGRTDRLRAFEHVHFAKAVVA
jgi:methyltransferase (TIGR00027 family)